ncbi:hypothetical protein [Desulfosporosinus sp.]|uniref:hypothetical protein n=1 Tax=Desulfosporosinus sp. TaxID=157907 RepID=UPI000E9DB1FA|nr:hypothetical protein [Desulfosporosinus sp.]MBC2723573.1 hypothetical protein [Desulfosporosinus sp.]MBC2725322.1 hypothetical protein [Desulfosporosinus sp.]HBV85653.1 hypothetical protein [Desulfosporosinus sp.]
MNNLGDSCILEDRVCTECGDCDVCDLDPTKQCDDCCQCIKTPEGDYAEIEIDDVLLNTEDKTTDHPHKGPNTSYKIKTKGNSVR